MILDEVHIIPTEKTPEILLYPKGIIKIKGRAIAEDIRIVPEQIENWIDAYLLNPAESTDVIIALEYLNSFNTMLIISILRRISKVKLQLKKLVIKWYIEEDDYDLQDRGESISSALNIPIEFIMTDDIRSW
jgi:transcription elongation factor